MRNGAARPDRQSRVEPHGRAGDKRGRWPIDFPMAESHRRPATMLAWGLPKRLHEKRSHVLNRSEPRLGSNLLQRYVRLCYQPPRAFKLCVTYSCTDGIAQNGRETGFQAGTRNGDGTHDVRDLDSL